MNDFTQMLGQVSNPFATRYTRPGAIPFHFPTGDSANRLLGRLQSSNWRGQILGPHGSGKSTLLRSLEPHWPLWNRQPITITLHDGQSWLPVTLRQTKSWQPGTQIIIDGYEQLSLVSRCWLSACTLRCGLLVTTHDDVGLPLIQTTQVTPELARALVQKLAPNEDWHLEVTQRIDGHSGNMREAFFQLYDLFEQKRGVYARE